MSLLIGNTEGRVLADLSQEIAEMLDKVGIFYRLFYRLKSEVSLKKKLLNKHDDYVAKGKKLQDLFGIRVTVYFADDQSIVVNLLKNRFKELPEDHSIDQLNDERFGIVRYNLMFELPSKYFNQCKIFDNESIAATFELQLRTVFSEGWHEIEHDLRYKCKKDWFEHGDLSRQLNSQSAVLESCDWSMLKIFDEFSYAKYKAKEWSSFFRNLVRIRFTDEGLSEGVIEFFNKNKHVAKELMKIDRENLILPISQLAVRTPLKMDNVLFIINRFSLDIEELKGMEPVALSKILDVNKPQPV